MHTEQWKVALNFRATAGFTADGPGQVYVLGDQWPTTRAAAWALATFGWLDSSLVNERDRSAAAGVAPEFAGINLLTSTSSSALFLLRLPEAGIYDVRLALGDALFSQNYYVIIQDFNSPLATIGSPTASNTTNQYVDSWGIIRTSPGDWDANNLARRLPFRSGILALNFPPVSQNANVIAHMEVSAMRHRQRFYSIISSSSSHPPAQPSIIVLGM